MGKAINIGIDVGNYDTKSQSSTTPSGFGVYSKPPFGADEILEFDGTYYVPEVTRFPYVKDKTTSQNAFTLSLFGIAKEILMRAEKKAENQNGIQPEIDKVTHINLGVGLPPTHMAKQEESLREYYVKNFGTGITFSYNNYSYNLKLNRIRVYPQDFAAVMTFRPKKTDFISTMYKSYYAIDIGGYTVDVVPIINGAPDVKKCDSKELGVLKMFDDIVTTVERETGISLNPERIESVLKEENTPLPDEVKTIIYDSARAWIEQILNQLRQGGLEFAAYPVIFIGGGAQLFKKYIEDSKILHTYGFIPSARANAEGYKRLLEIEARAVR